MNDFNNEAVQNLNKKIELIDKFKKISHLKKAGFLFIAIMVSVPIVTHLTYGSPFPCSALKKKMRTHFVENLSDNPLALAMAGNLIPALDSKIDSLNQFECLRGLSNVSSEKSDSSPDLESSTRQEKLSKKETQKIKKMYSSWNVTEDTSPVDDSKTITLIRYANDKVGEGYLAEHPALILRCKENQTDVFVATDEMVKDSGSIYDRFVPVIVRYDTDPAEEVRMSESANSQSFFFTNAIPAIKTMAKKEKMLVRYYSYSGSERTVTFNLTGLTDHVGKLSEACNWPED